MTLNCFMKKNFLTKPRVAALEILGRGALEPTQFVVTMWGAAVPIQFGTYFLSGLMSLGLVERRKADADDVYALTESGKGLLATLPWKCGYCGKERWKSRGVSIFHTGCRQCKGDHWACRACSRKLAVADGEFPHFRSAVRQCPGGGTP